MAYSDKELVARARRRLNILKKNGIRSDAVRAFENNLRIFYDTTGLRQTSKTGISITKKMNVGERYQMRTLLRSFMSEDTSVSDIEREYKEKFNYYNKHTNMPNILPASNVKEMSERLTTLDRVLTDRAITYYYDSEQLSAVYGHQKVSGVDAERYRKALLDMVVERVNDNLMASGSEVEIDYKDVMFLDTKGREVFSDMSTDEIIDEVIARAMR